MAVDKKIINAVKKSFLKLDFSKMEEICGDEAKTRMYLIEPILEILGYSRMDEKDMLTEISAGWGQKNERADLALIIKGKTPEIIIECKKLGKKLTDKEASQLNNYFINTKGSKIGILTNGFEWRFYAQNEATKETKLYEIPFLTLFLNEMDDITIEKLAAFHKNAIDIKEVLEDAQNEFFLQGFSDAFTEEMINPSDEFIKAIFNKMGHMEGRRLTEKIKEDLKKLINSNNIQSALPKIIESESKNGNIVITTAEELKIYHAVKTIIINSVKKIDYSRVSYRDQKNSFSILVDDNQRKVIAKITSNKDSYFIEIPGKIDKIPFKGLDSIVNLNKQIIEVAKNYLLD